MHNRGYFPFVYIKNLKVVLKPAFKKAWEVLTKVFYVSKCLKDLWRVSRACHDDLFIISIYL